MQMALIINEIAPEEHFREQVAHDEDDHEVFQLQPEMQKINR